MTRIYGSTKSQERRSWGEGGTHKRQKPQERGGGESGTKGATETPGERGGEELQEPQNRRLPGISRSPNDDVDN